ncbi:uncharacterized protein LOC111087223 [Limulus polyphemus]|uniref:Uncharacterized protein LOC111087223 n=1 Tax=Limulus polyphemus TaxID=6850 RepID=A0ABM1SZ11_LIMPO|nr:uncharacterized protein LOC111087223 [Limulus polyphemus]
MLAANYSCCESPVSPDFVVHFIQSLPQGSIPVIISDTYHCAASESGSVVKELQKNSIKIVTNSLTFRSLGELQYGVTNLEKTIECLSGDSKQIFIFTLCFNVARLLPQVDKIYRSFPWVRWVLLTTGQKQMSDYTLFQEYPFSSCKIAMPYEAMTGCSSGHCSKRQKTNYIIEGPDIENFNCSKRVRIAKWVDKKFLPGKPNDFFCISRHLHFSGRKLRVAAVSLFPFFVQEVDSTGEIKGKEGIDLKLLEILAEKYNFRPAYIYGNELTDTAAKSVCTGNITALPVLYLDFKARLHNS